MTYLAAVARLPGARRRRKALLDRAREVAVQPGAVVVQRALRQARLDLGDFGAVREPQVRFRVGHPLVIRGVVHRWCRRQVPWSLRLPLDAAHASVRAKSQRRWVCMARCPVQYNIARLAPAGTGLAAGGARRARTGRTGGREDDTGSTVVRACTLCRSALHKEPHWPVETNPLPSSRCTCVLPRRRIAPLRPLPRSAIRRLPSCSPSSRRLANSCPERPAKSLPLRAPLRPRRPFG